jgi:siderophore synthetase component
MNNAVFLLDKEEKNILEYLHAYRTDIKDLFLHFVPQARKGILHRFMQATVREEIISRQHIMQRDGQLVIKLKDAAELQVSVQQFFSFGRFDVTEAVVTEKDGYRRALQHPIELLDVMKREGWIKEGLQYDRFRQELQNSAANYALALAGAELRKQSLVSLSPSSIEWVEKQMDLSEQFSPLAFYEQWVVDGHPLHPGAKIKMGMETADVMKYSPEWEAYPNVRVAAVHQDFYQDSYIEKRFTEILYDEYPKLRECVKEELQSKGLHKDDYKLLLLHPWQAEHTIPTLCEKEIREGNLVLLTGFHIPAAALMSFRSLAPLQSRGMNKHHIKTAVNVQTTGAIRTVSPHSVQNGPMLSKVFHAIQAKEQWFHDRFRILEEQAGAHFEPNANLSEEKRLFIRKQTGALLRENPENYVGTDEIAMPGSALLAVSPFSDKSIGAELIEAYAKNKGIFSIEKAVLSFVEQYAQVCLPPLLTLMSKYGVSMEGHLQNSVMIFRKGEPIRLLVRDFGGVRILHERLEKQRLKVLFYPGSAIIADDVEDTRNKMFYPVLQNHFGELIASLVRYFHISEEQMWALIAKVCKETFQELKKDAVIQEQVCADEQALFAYEIDLKAMVTMRLCGDVTDYTFSKVPNPLASALKGDYV